MAQLYRVLSYLASTLCVCRPEDRQMYRDSYRRVQDVILAERLAK
jgi:hypothetical protein